MQQLIRTVPAAQPHLHVRLVLESFDSADECSFVHLQELYTLLEEGDITDEIALTEIAREMEQATWN